VTVAQDHLLRARAPGVSSHDEGDLRRVPDDAPLGEMPDSRGAAQALASQCGLPFIDSIGDEIPTDVLAALPRAIVVKYLVCPLGHEADRRLRVALVDPVDLELRGMLEHLAGVPIAACVATADELRRAIARHYDLAEGEMKSLLAGLQDAEDETSAPVVAISPDSSVRPETGESDAPVIRLVEKIIGDAVRLRASDIHLEPLECRFRVRCRIDGAMVETDSPPRHLQRAVISRLKIMARLSIAEKRLPQDGRIPLVLDGRALDLRVSTLPTAHGESIVMRLLDRNVLPSGLAELGFTGNEQEEFRQLITAPDGMVLITGPTGSGKTTTLYGCLQHLNQTDRKIITVEDPIEYQLSGVNQVPVRAEIGMTFASALRAMLRQSPNVIMVGEIRDRETADIAINAALTGHLVFSTLHTNDAPAAITRLVDIGAKPFLVAASLRATIAQRLVRRICARCKTRCTPPESVLRAAGLEKEQVAGAAFFRGAGCPVCLGTGFRGRVGIFEIFLINDEIRDLIGQNTSAARLRAEARGAGMRTLREDGLRKVLAGLTTIDEIVAVTSGGEA
jgi:type IV pilus assembly protein PilB